VWYPTGQKKRKNVVLVNLCDDCTHRTPAVSLFCNLGTLANVLFKNPGVKSGKIVLQVG